MSKRMIVIHLAAYIACANGLLYTFAILIGAQ